jgi:hypothetical protein
MEFEGWLPSSQEFAISPYLEPDDPSPSNIFLQGPL